MKKFKVVLLGLIAGLAMTACSDDGYIECSAVVLNESRTITSSHVHALVAKYRSSSSFELSTKNRDEKGYYYSYFFVMYDKKMEEPEFPKTATCNYEISAYNKTYVSLNFVSLIGKYESYNKVFLSKDKKTLKITVASFNPISAPNDKEVQGKTVGRIYTNNAGEIENEFVVNVSGTLTTSIESTYQNIEDNNIQYTVIEK